MVVGGVSAGFAQLAMTKAYTPESAARVSGMSYLTVVASALLGVIVLGERPPGIAIFGVVLVIAGGVLVTLGRAPRAPLALREPQGEEARSTEDRGVVASRP